MLIAFSIRDAADPADGLAVNLEAPPRAGETILLGERVYRVLALTWVVDRPDFGDVDAIAIVAFDAGATEAYGKTGSFGSLHLVWDRDRPPHGEP